MRVHFPVLLIAAVVSAACDDEIATPPDSLGSLVVSVETTGGDLDPDGYLVTVDGDEPVSLTLNGSVTLEGFSAGPRVVELQGVAANCAVVGENPVSVSTDEGVTVEAAFDVACIGTGVEVSASTVGVDAPSGYGVTVDGGLMAAVAPNGVIRVARLTPGDHVVELTGVRENCTVGGANPLTVTVTEGETASVAFSVSCVATSGVIDVSVLTTGLDRDRSGYRVTVNGGAPRSLPREGSVAYELVAAGEHVVAITDVASNCTVDGGATRPITVSTGAMTRDTARVAFEIGCDRVWELAFTRMVADDYGPGTAVYMSAGDGSDSMFVAWAEEAEWSPDGAEIVLTSCDEWSYYYYGTACLPIGLIVVGTEGETPRTIATPGLGSGSVEDATWRPDGERIAFVRNGRSLQLVDPDGSAEANVNLPAVVRAVGDPSWSPDGLTLAFTCEIDAGNEDICTVGADGAGFARLTTDPDVDARPAWSPSGASIAFTTTRFGVNELAIMAPNGTGLTRPSPGTGASAPSWSPDGTMLAFARLTCDGYSGCTFLGLSRMNADGSEITQITSGPSDHAPSWRR